MENQEFGEPGYAVIDVEALILGPRVRVVEQVAFVLMSSATGREILSEKHMVLQQDDLKELCNHYSQKLDVVNNAVLAYRRITGDDPVHADPMIHPSWSAVKNRVRKILRHRAIKVYAKGAALERTVFGYSIEIDDLENYGCPKYPLAIHDPLEECRFFSRYIPELQKFHQPNVHNALGPDQEEIYPVGTDGLFYPPASYSYECLQHIKTQQEQNDSFTPKK